MGCKLPVTEDNRGDCCVGWSGEYEREGGMDSTGVE